uniref:Uncharacterized protein n=1 Tax=Lygus hesperus TaxID=30085 RepID=A0A146LKI3_LYGHE
MLRIETSKHASSSEQEQHPPLDETAKCHSQQQSQQPQQEHQPAKKHEQYRTNMPKTRRKYKRRATAAAAAAAATTATAATTAGETAACEIAPSTTKLEYQVESIESGASEDFGNTRSLQYAQTPSEHPLTPTSTPPS